MSELWVLVDVHVITVVVSGGVLVQPQVVFWRKFVKLCKPELTITSKSIGWAL